MSLGFIVSLELKDIFKCNAVLFKNCPDKVSNEVSYPVHVSGFKKCYLGGADAQMEHAGFLMALGLNGHLKNLVVMSTFEYIDNRHEMTSVGVMLGMFCHFFAVLNLLIIHYR